MCLRRSNKLRLRSVTTLKPLASPEVYMARRSQAELNVMVMASGRTLFFLSKPYPYGHDMMSMTREPTLWVGYPLITDVLIEGL